MNSKQRRVRIRAGMPGALRRPSILCLLGDIDPGYAADLKGALNISKLSLAQFESLVQCIGVVERRAERERTIKSYITSTGYSGRTPHMAIFDKAATIK